MYRKRGRRIEDNFVQLKLVPNALIQFDYLHMLKSMGGRGGECCENKRYSKAKNKIGVSKCGTKKF